jgi:cation diffusion facilitator CzcD-associated flavoprotein CzcO
MPMGSREDILVIGAGPTGLSVAKAFQEAGISYVQAESQDRVGGNWAHGVYSTAHIISSKKTTEFPDHPMPDSYPDFPSAEQMRLYFQSYAEDFSLLGQIRFHTRVDGVRQRDDKLWEAVFSDGTEGVFKGVAVCNGHHWKRSFPGWRSEGEPAVIHSKDYRDPSQLAGKRILVVGAGNSGCDIVSEAARVGASADWSLRRGYWFLPKTLFGRPSVEFMQPWLPVFVQRLLMRALVRVSIGRYQDYGLPAPDHRLFDAHPTVNSEIFHYLKHGKITLQPDIESCSDGEVEFTDGTVRQYDAVVCATGFDLSFPFLPEGTVPVEGKTPQLYAGMLRPGLRHLYIVGTYQPRYGIGPLLRPNALLLADFIKLQDSIPGDLGGLLQRLGSRPISSHLVDPHAAIRRMRMGRRIVPLLRWLGRRS